ncbi:MAG: hypothetical protein JWO35_128 [Candidatus Saccharibacteria bacterium]|nr:hypothetical protein [Candidatus Saccharibacteria bacterium]
MGFFIWPALPDYTNRFGVATASLLRRSDERSEGSAILSGTHFAHACTVNSMRDNEHMSERSPAGTDAVGESIHKLWQGYTREALEAKADRAPSYGSEVELMSFQAQDVRPEERTADMTKEINELCALFGVDNTNWTRYLRSAEVKTWERVAVSPEAITKMAAGSEIGVFMREWCFHVMPIEDSDDVHEMDSSVALTIQLSPDVQVKLEGEAAVWRWLEYTDPDTGLKYDEANNKEEVERLVEEDKTDIVESFVDYNMKFTAWFSRIDPVEARVSET